MIEVYANAKEFMARVHADILMENSIYWPKLCPPVPDIACLIGNSDQFEWFCGIFNSVYECSDIGCAESLMTPQSKLKGDAKQVMKHLECSRLTWDLLK